MPERVVGLSVTQSGDGVGAVYGFHIRLDGEMVASNQSLTREQSRTMRELSQRFGDLFEQRRTPQLAKDALAAMGAELHAVWLGPVWDRLAPRLGLGDGRLLVVGSDRPEVLNLPWELLTPPGDGPIGTDGRWGIRRQPWADRELPPAPALSELRAGPLRVLSMVCAPLDQAQLDYEREEEFLLRALGRLPNAASFDSGDLGTFEELEERVNAFQPHVVHLTGHAVAVKDGASFAFEDESGKTALCSAEKLAGLFAGSGVQCVFLSGCQAGRAPERAVLGGLAQGLIARGVPLAIGWAASVRDDLATDLASRFYAALAARQPVDRALAQAREAVRTAGEQRGDPSWALPVLYAGTRQALLVDPGKPADRAVRSSVAQQPLPGMTEGYAAQFIGRRRDIQQLLPALRSGDLQGVVLTGLGGAGKSTLATRLARKLEADGFTPLALSARDDRPLTTGAVLAVCKTALLLAGEEAKVALLDNAAVPLADRLRVLVSILNAHRFVLVLDNFESNLDRTSRRILDAELAEFYRHLIENLVGASRLIVTSRYLPADAPLPATMREWPLGEFGEADFLKFLLRDAEVERRYRSGDLTDAALKRLHATLGGTPRFLDQMRQVLRTMAAAELSSELDKVALPSAAEPGKLQTARDAYCEKIFTGRLYGELSAASQRMLSRAAVYGVAVTLEGLAAAAEVEQEAARQAASEWRGKALIHNEVSGHWAVYGLLRGWLMVPERLPAEDRLAAHRAAGEWLERVTKDDRENELGLGWVAALLEARAQYLAANMLDDAARVTGLICNAYLRQGLYGEIERLSAELLQRERRPDALGWLARSHLDRGSYKEARTLNGEALSLQQQRSDRAGEAATWHSLASIDLREGAYGPAREKFGTALRMLQEIGDRADEAATWHQLASIDVNEGAYGPAREKFATSLRIKQEIGDRAGEAATWHNLATIDLREGAYGPAPEKFATVLHMRQEIGDRAGEAATLHQLASIDLREGAYGPAREKFATSLRIKQEIGDRAGEAGTWHNLASIDLNEGAYGPAREKFATSLRIKQEIGDRAGEAATFFQLGMLAAKQGKTAEGLPLVAMCYLIDNTIGHGDAESDFRELSAMAASLNYTQAQFEELLRDVAMAYERDRGAELVRQAGDDASQGEDP